MNNKMVDYKIEEAKSENNFIHRLDQGYNYQDSSTKIIGIDIVDTAKGGLQKSRSKAGFGVDFIIPTKNGESRIKTFHSSHFDGKYTMYSNKNHPVIIEWDNNLRANQLTFTIYANNNSCISIRVDDKEVYKKNLKKDNWDNIYLNLVPYPDSHSVKILSECTQENKIHTNYNTNGNYKLCASLSFPKITVFAPEPWWSNYYGGILVVIVGIIIIGYFLIEAKKYKT